MLLAEAPQCPSAELGSEAGEAAGLAQAAVGNEQPWRVSQVLEQLHHSAGASAVPGNSAGTAGCGVRDGQRGPRSGISPACPPGAEGEGGWSSQGCPLPGAQGSVQRCGERKPNLFCSSALPSAAFVS